MEITDKIVKEKGLTTIMVTHNVDHAIRYGNRLIMLDRGSKLIDISERKKLSNQRRTARII